MRIETADRERRRKRWIIMRRGARRPVSPAELNAAIAASRVPVQKLAPGVHCGWIPTEMGGQNTDYVTPDFRTEVKGASNAYPV